MGQFSGTQQNIIDTIMKIASNETVLETLAKCFSIAHPHVLKQTMAHADKLGFQYESGYTASVDLFALEEIVTAIVPLFLRLARRTCQAMKAIGTQIQV